MPSRSEPFPEAEVRRWGRFSGAPTDEQLSRFFVLMGVHRLEDRIQQAVAEPPVGQHSVGPGLEP